MASRRRLRRLPREADQRPRASPVRRCGEIRRPPYGTRRHVPSRLSDASATDADRVLVAQVAEIRLGIERAARDALERLLRRQLAAERVEIFAQPVAELAELALLEALLDVRAAPPAPPPRSARSSRCRAGRSGSSRRGPLDQCTSWSTPSRSSGTGIPRYSSNRAFHASGRSAVESVPAISSCSSSNRRMMCMP